MNLVWFRNDLRVQDNEALSAAMDAGPTLAVFLLCPAQWRHHAVGNNRISFLLRCLADLKQALEALGVPLICVSTDNFAAAPAALLKLAKAQGITAIHAGEEQPLNERIRDSKVALACATQDIEFTLHAGSCLVPPGAVRKGDGGAYSVFTPFKKQWLAQITKSHYTPIPPPKPQAALKLKKPLAVRQLNVPNKLDGASATHQAELWPGGRKAAEDRLTQFVEQHIDDYQAMRDLPAKHGTSTLSPYLSIGAISPRQCLHAAVQANHGELVGVSDGINTWVSELVWRDFYRHVVTLYPHVNQHQPFRPAGNKIRWRTSDEDFAAWCEGRTGYPLVDAAMRQLVQTGWMHNRLRMVTAMFLTKHLLLPWRWGEDFFMQHLVDGDFAANNGGWQWSASTGTDAAPYFRIFNPASQAERFDPNGEFVCRYVPELETLWQQLLNEPATRQLARNKKLWFDPGKAAGEQAQWFRNAGYPKPIVEHSFARQRALDRFKQAGARG